MSESKDGSGSQNNRNRRGRGRRSRSSGGGHRGGRGEAKRDYLPSDAELAEEEANLDREGDDGLEGVVVNELKSKSVSDLTELAESMDVENAAGLRKQDLIFAILKTQTEIRG